MTDVMKKGLGLVVVLFLIWFLFTDPAGAASMTREGAAWVWELLVQLFTAVSRFLSGLFA